jgi:uncharacterized protein YbjT (DUF2867 family)
MKRAVVAGGTGLVGRHLLHELAQRSVETVAFGRREGPSKPALEWRIVEGHPLSAADIPPGTDAAFCCLGTTIKDAGSQEAFRAVDHGLVLAFARACRDAGVPQFHLVSAMGANPRSRIFYSRVKGEVERDVAALGFPSLVVYRPSFLDGERDAHRPGEQFGLRVARLLRPVLPADVRAVPAAAVARAMVLGARAAPEGMVILRSGQVARAGA